MLTALQLLKDQLKDARQNFAGTVKDINPDHLHQHPGGKALPLGATYAHLVFSEDVVIHQFIQSKPPLFTTTWKNKTGASAPMPPMDQDWSTNHANWANSVKITLPQLQIYSQAVFDATNKYLNSLKPEDLDTTIDLGDWGKKTLAELFFSFIIGHLHALTGEISALKGIQGAQGYPF